MDRANAILAISDAAEALRRAEQFDDELAVAHTNQWLQEAVQEANEVGVSWQAIGDLLDMRRGAAYQRFRRRPSTGRHREIAS